MSKKPLNQKQKTFLKNLQILQDLLTADKFQLVFDLLTLAKQYNSGFNLNKFLITQFKGDEAEIALKKFASKRKKLGILNYKKLNADIKVFLRKADLGSEWIDTFLLGILCNCFVPPIYNLHISTAQQISAGKQRVLLVLNPDTSIDDIKLALPAIQAEQKKLWPKYQKRNYRPKGFEHNMILAKQELIELAQDSADINGMYQLSKIHGSREITELLLGLKAMGEYSGYQQISGLTNLSRTNLIFNDDIKSSVDEQKKTQTLKKLLSRRKKKK